MKCYCPETREEKDPATCSNAQSCFVNPANRPLLQEVADGSVPECE